MHLTHAPAHAPAHLLTRPLSHSPFTTPLLIRLPLPAQANGYYLRIRAGGHSFTGESTCNTADCLQIDLRAMNDVSYDPDSRLVTVGPGAVSGDIYSVLDPVDKTVVSGTCLPVGYSGERA